MRISPASFCLTCISVGLLLSVHSSLAADFNCQPYELYEKQTFTHVACTNSIVINGDEIKYIALRHTDFDKLKRFQDIAASVLTSSVSVDFIVRIPDSGAGNIAGCNASDCREAERFGIRRR
jgi:hypothetical protein